jgi:hypothetical protein
MASKLKSRTINEEPVVVLHKPFQKNKEKGATTNILLDLCYTDKKKKKNRQDCSGKPMSLMNIDTKILNEILEDKIQEHLRGTVHCDWKEFIHRMQGSSTCANQLM